MEKTIGLGTRARRHIRLTLQAIGPEPAGTPPFLILFVNSICNLTCEHCFYWRNLNRRDDLTFDEIAALSRDLGPVENLNLSGGEPFLRKEFAEICRQFIEHNGTRQIYVPTNGYFTDRTVKALETVLENKDLWFFVCELSLDGTEAYHDRFRGSDKSFAKALETYDALAALQERDPRLRIHAISTATAENLDEIRRLTEYLYQRCPRMDHHNLALIRGDRKNPSLQGPLLAEYCDLTEHVRRVWAPRERGRFGGSVEPLLHWAKVRTAEEHRQVVPCTAGLLTGVVYANGDVSVCETHQPLGNLRQQSFRDIWFSRAAHELRASVARGDCHCTNEVFLWPSVTFQPRQLIGAMIKSRMPALSVRSR
ncbi:MAG: radical SAM/SPASM domain-containing protein [Vicinamibacterales bacterium]